MTKSINIKEGQTLSIEVKNIIKGHVIKGPLSNAFVFLDKNRNGKYDEGEPFARTDADGYFELESNTTGANIIVTTDITSN